MEFCLIHQMLLLSLRKNGSFTSNSFISLNFGLAGGLLSELAIRGHIEIKDNRVTVLRPDAKNRVFDMTLKIIEAKKKPKSVQYWVSNLSYKIAKIKREALNDLVDNGILAHERKKILFFIPYHRYPLLKPEVQKLLHDEIRNILINDKKAGIMQVLLISLLQSCNAFYDLFPVRAERKMVNRKATDLIENRLKTEIPEAAQITKAVDQTKDGHSQVII